MGEVQYRKALASALVGLDIVGREIQSTASAAITSAEKAKARARAFEAMKQATGSLSRLLERLHALHGDAGFQNALARAMRSTRWNSAPEPPWLKAALEAERKARKPKQWGGRRPGAGRPRKGSTEPKQSTSSTSKRKG